MKKCFQFLLLIVMFSGVLSGQKYAFEIQEINVKDGLPHRSIYDVTQDRQGYIWLTYQGGICRYDGYNFKTYSPSLLNIGQDAVHLVVDKKNRIWYCEYANILTEGFSGVLDPKTDSILTFDEISNGLISSTEIVSIKSSHVNPNEIFIATYSGIIFKYDDEEEKFEQLFDIKEKGLSKLHCESFRRGVYWIAAHNRIFKKDENTGEVVEYNTAFKDKRIDKLIPYETNFILEAVIPHKRELYKIQNDKFEPLLDIPTNLGLYKEHYLYNHSDFECFIKNSEIVIADHSGNRLASYELNNEFKTGFGFTVVHVDREGIIWIATSDGLFKITAKKIPFETFLSGTANRAIFKKGSKVYVSCGAENHIIDTETNEVAPLNLIGNFEINSLTKDNEGIIWGGTNYSNVLKCENQNQPWETIDIDEEIIASVVFFNPITEKLFVGTERNGIFYLDRRTYELTPLFQPEVDSKFAVRQFFQSGDSILVATTRGVLILDGKTEEIIGHISSANSELPFDEILHIAQDRTGIFWLGTKGGGLIRWNFQKNTFRQFTTKTGLSNNTIYAVYPDKYGKLWLPSNYGLMCFDRKNFETIVYSVQNGIPHEEFNTFSHYQGEDGMLYFGGLNGVVKFHPKDMQTYLKTETPLYLLRAEVLGEDEKGWLNKTEHFQSENVITLYPDDRVLNLEVALLDYERPLENRYAYKIKGFQDKWIYTAGHRITITKPDYGDYTLQIKGRGASGTWSKEILSIPLLVAKPFYLKTWFLVLVAIALLGLFFTFVKWRIRLLKERQLYLESEVKKRTAIIEKDKSTILAQAETLKELDKNKTRFFSNVAHEIRTPLTLITGPLQQLIEEQPPESRLQKRLTGISANANQLLLMTNQLLDISKLENGKLKTQFSYGDIAGFTRDLVSRFEQATENKEIYLKNIEESKVWRTYFDADQWNKIVHNLISNALKFTANGGRIEVILSDFEKDGDSYISLLVKDSGIGMTVEQVDNIYDRFYQVDGSNTRTHGGSGIGLSLVKELVDMQGGKIYVNSKVGVGTEFRVLLPIREKLEDEVTSFLESSTSNTTVDEKEEAFFNHFESFKPETEKLNILIVEDNDEMREYIKSCLTNKYNVLEAQDGEVALEIALSEQPDLIISDVMMPKKDGYELTAALRENIITSHIPVLLLTAKISNESRMEGLEVGADDYLTKPFNAKELILKIENFIKLRDRIHYRFTNPDQFPINGRMTVEEEFVAKIRDYVLENIETGNLNGDVIGKHMNMSRVHLYRKLKAITGKTITEFVKEIRLKKAMELIRTKRWNVSEITDKTGFSSISHFSRSFKQAYGKAPSEVLQHV